MSPLDDFLSYEQKTAAPMFAKGTGRGIGQMALMGAVGAGTTAAIAGLVPAATTIYNAATKGRDFRGMLEFDPELKELHKQNPKYVNAGFSTLRRMNPEFSKDPMVASAFVKQVAYGNTEGSFGLAQEALRSAPRPGAMEEAFVSGAGLGVGAGMSHQMKLLQMAAEPGPEVKAKAEHGFRMQQIQEQERLKGQSGMDQKKYEIGERRTDAGQQFQRDLYRDRFQAGLRGVGAPGVGRGQATRAKRRVAGYNPQYPQP